MKCAQCPETVPEDHGLNHLCLACSMELMTRVCSDNTDGPPIMRQCEGCNSAFPLTESRVVRSVKNPGSGDPDTPWLCWVCVRLYNSAKKSDPKDYYSCS